MNLPEPCPICGTQRPRNDEDVLPIWARTFLLESVPRDGTWEFPARVKIRICVECNTQVAKVYEASTAPLLKPMIAGQTVIGLTPRQQSLIGRWCIKTVLLLHMKHAMTLGKYHKADGDALLLMNRGGLPPDATSVRIARCISGTSSGCERAFAAINTWKLR